MELPRLLVADHNNQTFDIPGFQACGQSGHQVSPLSPDELIPLPPGSQLYFLPDRMPVGFEAKSGRFEAFEEVFPVAAFLPAGYTLTASTAYRERPGAQLLPLFAYAPVAFYKKKMYVPAVRIDRRTKHDLTRVDHKELQAGIRRHKGSSNRLIPHLTNCALVNCCPNAINLFLGKFEAPIPVSPSCNAQCLGCISFQPKGSCPATQARLKFIPTPEEMADIALTHIQAARQPIVSFGQGCEGEPLMQAEFITEAIKIIRRKTSRGTLHINTNGSRPLSVAKLCQAGLDSIRVSLNSARDEYYHKYYAPKGYTFSDVKNTILTAKKCGKFVSLNYLTMPGFTDMADEYEAFSGLIGESQLDMVQWRNLNYDPQAYFRKLGIEDQGALVGINGVLKGLRRRHPKLRSGYFNVYQPK